jgi:hypothetical protein
LQHIIPVNGLLSIKGDLAKSMIFNSGKLKTGTWVEKESGSIEEGNFAVEITATRSDNGQTLSRSFSVAQAKRAGLWVTEQQVSGSDGWKYKTSAWWKFPSRMINYRALGFLARDMFPDVLAGIYTTEEAMDMPRETAEVIETESGAKIIIPDKEHAKKRSDKLTERVVQKIEEKATFTPVVTDEDTQYTEIQPEGSPLSHIGGYHSNAALADSGKTMQEVLKNMDDLIFTPQRGSVEVLHEKIINRQATDRDLLSLESMEKMDTKVLLEMINKETDMIEAMNLLPGKNTNKKLREIIFAHQEGRLTEYVASILPPPNEENQGNIAPDIKPNTGFDKQGEKKPEKGELFAGELDGATNKYGIAIPEFDKGQQRDFGTMKSLFNLMVSVNPPVNNPRYLEIGTKMGILHAYPDREQFCKFATVKEINQLLNQN